MMNREKDFGTLIEDILKELFVDGSNARANRFKVFFLAASIVLCCFLGYLLESVAGALHLFAVCLLFFLSVFWLKRRKILIVGGFIWLSHLIFFPIVYLSFAKRHSDSFRFNSEVFDIEKTILQRRLDDQVEILTKDSKWMETLVNDYKDTLSINFRDFSKLDSVVLGGIVLVPDLIVLDQHIPSSGGGGLILPDDSREKFIVKITDGTLIREYPISASRPIWSSDLLVDIIKDQKDITDSDLRMKRERLNSLLNKDDIWTYDNFLNYSVKIFLFDSPITPHVGFVNQIYVLHLVILMILSSKFFYYLNKE